MRARSSSSEVGGVVGDGLDDLQQSVASRVERLILSDLGGEVCRAGIVELEVAAERLAGLLRLDQGFVQAACWRVAKHQHDQVERGEIGIRTRRQVVRRHDPLHVADATDRSLRARHPV